MNNSRFSAENRLLKSSDFNSVFGQNQKCRDRNWIIISRKNDKSYARLGMAITKKNVSKAVQRNYIRRIIREAFRSRKNQLVCLDIVVLVSYSIRELTRREQVATLENLFDKLIEQTRVADRENSLKSDE